MNFPSLGTVKNIVTTVNKNPIKVADIFTKLENAPFKEKNSSKKFVFQSIEIIIRPGNKIVK